MIPTRQEVRQAIRSLLRSPGFTLPVVLVLGLGLGSNVALYSILETVTMRHLPVRDREGLVLVKAEKKGETRADSLTYPQFEDLAAASTPFAEMQAGLGGSNSTTRITLDGRSRTLAAPLVGAGWARMLGIQMSLGRAFTKEEDASGAPVAILSHRLWKTFFRGDPGILGRVVSTDGNAMAITIVGVGPEHFDGLEMERADLWMPLHALEQAKRNPLPPDFYTNRTKYSVFDVVARLKPGASLAQAQTSLDVASAIQARLHPESNSGVRYVAVDLGECERHFLGQVLPQQTLLRIAAALALLLAAVSATGLFAARASKREREMATRSALGAGTGDLARPLLIEALLLAIVAAPVALWTGLLLARRFILAPGELPAESLLMPAIDVRLLVFGASLSLLSLLAAASLPILGVRRLQPASLLGNQGGRSVTRSASGIFVALQVALSLVLVAASSMALGTFRKAAQMGYPTRNRALMVVDGEQDGGLSLRILARLKAYPDVLHAARSIITPLDPHGIATFSLSGGEQTETLFIPAGMSGADWFHALGVPLKEGRDFRAGDGMDKVILNETLARRFFPAGSAVGRFLSGSDPKDGMEVIGVVPDHRMRPNPNIHLPMIWVSDAYFDVVPTHRFCILAEGSHGARPIMARLREALTEEKPGAQPEEIRTLDDQVASMLRQENQNLRLLGSLGLGSLMLACFGLWSALQLQVALRWRELGIRSALGASAQRLALRILALGSRVLLLGMAGGIGLIWVLARFAFSRFPGLPPIGWLDITHALGALCVSGLLACLIPAFRAGQVQPADALRAD